MTELIEALVLGIVQGLTEFLPVSSSGHLEIAKVLLGDDSLAEQSMLTTVFLHFATAIATIVVFRNDIAELISGVFSGSSDSISYLGKIILSMIPAVIIGLLFEEQLEQLFHRNLLLVGIMLIITGVLLFISEKMKPGNGEVTFTKSIIIGLAQAIAILPGISRSGSTIATALILGVDKSIAAKFSFLIVLPLIFGKMAKDLLSGDLSTNMPSVAYLLVGFVSAFIAGIIACKYMLQIVKRSKLSWFAIYCLLVGLFVIIHDQLS